MTSSEAIRQDRELISENPIETEIAQRFAKITEKLKTQQHEPLSTADKQLKLETLTRDAHIPRRHSVKKELEGEEWLKTLGLLKGKLGTGFIVALIGIRGAGKTQMGVSLIQENISRLKSSRFISAMDIFLDIKASFRKDATTDERQIVEEYCKPRLLVIDEIQERAESAWEDRILTHLINRRYNDEKDTLLVGNIAKETFKTTMGMSIISRLIEMGGIIECNWESFRK